MVVVETMWRGRTLPQAGRLPASGGVEGGRDDQRSRYHNRKRDARATGDLVPVIGVFAKRTHSFGLCGALRIADGEDVTTEIVQGSESRTKPKSGHETSTARIAALQDEWAFRITACRAFASPKWLRPRRREARPPMNRGGVQLFNEPKSARSLLPLR